MRPMLRAALLGAWLALGMWFAAILLPAPPPDLPGALSLGEVQRLLRRLALATSEAGLALLPQAEIRLDGRAAPVVAQAEEPR
ncbi:hypothetical protein [Siccirubricoccus phaeus]|uniref:hypothetical protein n=1 Tax=Siccirubricoccus phaeus TaxID=2595053 RepID=UPI0011F20287|nr:hypothetical protein [Siccirubricoccus phaeus]